jgi:hypothetical protein
MNRKYYTGVGSRKTPPDVLDLMRNIAQYLQRKGYTLRSGGAQGADSAFEEGAGIDKNIFYAKDACEVSMEIAAQFHPAWDRCSDYAKKLHGRNAFQVLGRRLCEPSEFLICWTPDGCSSHKNRAYKTGGTGTAISIADAYGVKVYNLAISSVYDKWSTIVRESEQQLKEESMNSLTYIYTAHYRYPGEDRTDITVKGQDPMGKAFAPTWDIVNGVKNGSVSEQEYVDRYLQILHNIPRESWEWLFSRETRTFVCFCAKDAFCHRNILLNYLLAQYGDRMKYMGWRD